MRRLSVMLLASIAVLLAAGCGGSAREDFENSVVETRNAVDGALSHITDNPSSREELLRRMQTSAERIDRAAGDLDRGRAPDELAEERDRLVNAYRQLAVDLSTAASELRNPEFNSMVVGSRGISFNSWDRANRVLTRLRAEGIDVKPLGRH